MDATPSLNIDSFSFKDLFWIQFNENRISIESPLLPKNVHLTIAYNSDSPDVNVHLSKNTSVPETKPKVEIIRISKTLLDGTLRNKIFTFIFNLIEPVNLEEQEFSGQSVHYIAQEDIQDEGEKILLGSFSKSDYRIKKKKLSVKVNLAEKLEELGRSQQLQSLYKSKLKPSSASINTLEAGMTVLENRCIAVMKIFGKWYKLKDDYTIHSVLKGIVSAETLTNIERHFKESLLVIGKAKTNADTELQNKKSIRLQIKPVLQRRLTLAFGRNYYSFN